ncbi:MAG: hypothetical protein ABH829_05635 [archaeon]
MFGKKKYLDNKRDTVYCPIRESMCSIAEICPAAGKDDDYQGLALLIGVAEDETWRQFAEIMPDTYFVLAELDGESLDTQIKRARKAGIENFGVKQVSGSGVPFSDKMFKRIESHYVLTSQGSRGKVRFAKPILDEYFRVLDDDGVLLISGELRIKGGDEEDYVKELHAYLEGKRKEGYTVGMHTMPLSETGTYYGQVNITYYISKDKAALKRELNRVKKVYGLKDVELK